MRRVVVTGLGLVTPLGAEVETVWKNLLAGMSGAGRITRFDASDQKCLIACEVKPADHPYGFDPNKRVDHKVQRQVDPFIIYGIDAAGQAIEDAGLTDMTEAQRLRAGCSIGSGIGGLPGIEERIAGAGRKGPDPRFPAFRPWPAPAWCGTGRGWRRHSTPWPGSTPPPGATSGARTALTVARLVLTAGLARTESRGAHSGWTTPWADPAQATRRLSTPSPAPVRPWSLDEAPAAAAALVALAS